MDKEAVSTEDVWDRYAHRLRSFILSRVRSEHDAEDVLQDVFYKIHRNIDSLKAQDKMESWVYRIARNAIVDHYRSRTKFIPLAGETPDHEARTDDREETPEDLLACLKPMIEDMPEKYRQAINLAEYGGLTQKEVAEKLGLSLSGAKSRIQRARGRLKEMLLKCCHFEFDRMGKILDYQPKAESCPYCIKDRSEG